RIRLRRRRHRQEGHCESDTQSYGAWTRDWSHKFPSAFSVCDSHGEMDKRVPSLGGRGVVQCPTLINLEHAHILRQCHSEAEACSLRTKVIMLSGRRLGYPQLGCIIKRQQAQPDGVV